MGKKAKETVKLRFKTLKNGEKSAYFDIYRNGVREYLWQDGRLIPETDENAKKQNTAVLQKLEEKRRSLIAELTIDQSGIADRSFNTGLMLTEWIDVYMEELSQRATGNYIKGVDTLKRRLENFKPGLLLKEADESTITSFYAFLQQQKTKTNEAVTLSEGTIWNLLKKLGNCMNGAIRERLIDTNPCRNILSICRKKQNKRSLVRLSQKELIKLIDTPYRMPEIKRIFLFSCFTGASICTIRQLLWKHIYNKGGRTWAILTQTRSGKQIDIPLTDIAKTCLPPRRRAKGSQPVFECKSKAILYFHILDWGKKAGINTPLNFRVAKNTYASLLLSADADFYTAKYMMGFSAIGYMEEYEGYLNGKRYDDVEKLDAIMEGLAELSHTSTNAKSE